MEKKLALLIPLVLAIGMIGGLIIGSMRTKSQHINTEYFIELKPNSVLIEDVDGNIISSPYDKLSETLIKDNL